MGDTTKIQWTDHTFNPWIGCTKVSAGCTNCYADAQDKRWGHDSWGPGKPRRRTSLANWRKPLQWNAEAERLGIRDRVFCASMADVFDAEAQDSWRHDLLELICRTPHLHWQLLTKRPERAMLFPDFWEQRNVWLGTSVEDQAAANKRIPELLKVPAAVRFLSCEPLLGPVDLTQWIDEDRNGFVQDIHWIIIGGESGPKARRMDAKWVRWILQQVRDAGRGECAVFVKQMGGNLIDRNDRFNTCEDTDDLEGWPLSDPDRVEEDIDGYRTEYQGAPVRIRLLDRKGGDPSEWPPELRVREFPEVRT